METIAKIYKIGYGPSSSHIMGPRKAADTFIQRFPDAVQIRFTLYGSLAATGKGHLTDKALSEVIGKNRLELIWKPEIFLSFHPNGMKFEALNTSNEMIGEWTTFSVGGGDIADENSTQKIIPVYEMNSMNIILKWCEENGRAFWEYVELCEGPDIWKHLAEVWVAMKDSILRGIDNEGVLPGSIKLRRKASSYLIKSKNSQGTLQSRSTVFAYALGSSRRECGRRYYRDSAYMWFMWCYSGSSIPHSNPVCCLRSENTQGISYSRINWQSGQRKRIHFGCTGGLPGRDWNSLCDGSRSSYATLSDGKHMVSFDKTVITMKQTGNDLPSLYKETSEGGLALFAKEPEK